MSTSPEVCWVCLAEEEANSQPLIFPCHCPRPVHATCLARWQLHSAGTREETHCRFCNSELPDWKPALTPDYVKGACLCPTMSVTYSGQVHHVAVTSGPRGYEDFVSNILRIFNLSEDHGMRLAFDCADPVTGQLMKLNGVGAYQAAVHCATISAAKRLRQAHSPGGPCAARGSAPDAPEPKQTRSYSSLASRLLGLD